jgi:magnesium transporter
VIVDCAHYRDGKRQHEGKLPLDVAEKCVVGDGDFVWLGLFEPTEEELRDVGERFGLHELALEDAIAGHQRPKLEDYDDSYFIVLKPARYDDEKEEVEFGEILVFAAPTYVIAIRHGLASGLGEARERLEAEPELLVGGSAAAVWAITDKVVDDYAPVVEGIDNDITEVEQEIFSEHVDSARRIYFLKREVIEFHNAVAPMLTSLEQVERGGVRNIDDHLRRYFRDVADHARRIDDRVNSQRELLTSILQANTALLGVRQNDVVRTISAYAAIITVPTFMASIWGMNFEHMPELDQPWGYPASLVLMAVVVMLLHRFFRRIDWL